MTLHSVADKYVNQSLKTHANLVSYILCASKITSNLYNTYYIKMYFTLGIFGDLRTTPLSREPRHKIDKLSEQGKLQ